LASVFLAGVALVFVFEVVALVFFAGSAFLVADFLAVDSFVTVVLVDFFGVVLVFAVAFLAVVALVVFLAGAFVSAFFAVVVDFLDVVLAVFLVVAAFFVVDFLVVVFFAVDAVDFFVVMRFAFAFQFEWGVMYDDLHEGGCLLVCLVGVQLRSGSESD
tara:strand:- start:734 stop:1210 length:477 start_codon:yes stop_codon:yes gene_type:complete